MADEHDIDRAAILARRQRFIAMAIAGLASGCKPSSSSSEPVEPEPVEPEEPVESERIEPEPEFSCDDDGLPSLPEPGPVPDDLDADERHARAQAVYDEGRRAFYLGEYDQAIIAWTSAYALAPELHLLAIQIADASIRGGRYLHAREVLERYLGEADPAVQPNFIAEAEGLLDTIERTCETRAARWHGIEPQVCLQPCLRIDTDRRTERRYRRQLKRTEHKG